MDPAKSSFELADPIAAWLQPQHALLIDEVLARRDVVERAARFLAQAHALDATWSSTRCGGANMPRRPASVTVVPFRMRASPVTRDR